MRDWKAGKCKVDAVKPQEKRSLGKLGTGSGKFRTPGGKPGNDTPVLAGSP